MLIRACSNPFDSLVITQCCIRHLYTAKDEPAIDQAKTFERRRCGHHELPEPLSTLDCLKEVVDPKSSQTNKHRYIIASQDTDVRAYMRNIPGVPLIYINRSVMIMEPMAEATDDIRLKEERLKFRSGLKSKYPQSLLGKRARDHNDHQQKDTQVPSEKKHARGTKGVNPLSMLKPKKKASIVPESTSTQELVSLEPAEEAVEGTEKKKRKRKSTVIKEKTLHMHEILMGRKNLRF